MVVILFMEHVQSGIMYMAISILHAWQDFAVKEHHGQVWPTSSSNVRTGATSNSIVLKPILSKPRYASWPDLSVVLLHSNILLHVQNRNV